MRGDHNMGMILAKSQVFAAQSHLSGVGTHRLRRNAVHLRHAPELYDRPVIGVNRAWQLAVRMVRLTHNGLDPIASLPNGVDPVVCRGLGGFAIQSKRDR